MAIVGNKNKRRGKYYEDIVADLFRKYSGLLKEDCCRSRLSGVGTIEYGDIYFKDFEYYGGFILECKYNKNNILDGIFPEFNKLYLSYFKEVYRYYNNYIERYNHPPKYWGIVHSKPYYKNYITLFNSNISFEIPIVKSKDLWYNDIKFEIVTMIYEDFLKSVFKEYINE